EFGRNRRDRIRPPRTVDNTLCVRPRKRQDLGQRAERGAPRSIFIGFLAKLNGVAETGYFYGPPFFGALLIRLERRKNEGGDKQPEQKRRDHQRERETHRDP